MAQNRGGGIRNELIELATAFYSLVDAGAAQRGVSHRAGDGGGRARGESISREGGESTEREGDGVLVARLVACFAHR